MMRRAAPLAVLVVFTALASAAAQGPRPAQGLIPNQDQNQPVQIEATTLEVRDKNKTATFSGNVKVVQGDTTMRCRSLVVFYGQEVGLTTNATPAAAANASPGTPPSAQNIRRIEARGGVTVVTKDQNASGDLGVYDLTTKTITLSGNVVVTQGQNVMHGERVIVDLTTGNARVESGNGAAHNKVRALILPTKGQNGGVGNFMTIGPGGAN
ncbi:MAG TPA: LptA/OstA family protein [Xanthobacteraceae bacterium]|jgi:lipopolysaccharide export system protein LptA